MLGQPQRHSVRYLAAAQLLASCNVHLSTVDNTRPRLAKLHMSRYKLYLIDWLIENNDFTFTTIGSVIPRWRTSSSSRVCVSKASAFPFVSRTVCSPYPPLSLRRPNISSRCCTDLEQSSAAYHICSVTSRLLLSLEDILLRTLLPVITVVVPAKWHCHLLTR